ncbi:MAG: HPr kinase/phosphorylase [Rhizomicrobium sp.]
MNIHASCVSLRGKGVLLLGESGRGKSDLALRLIDEGALLVADDRTELYAKRGRLCARSPKSIAGLMEVRGLGIVRQPFRGDTALALAVRVGAPTTRLPEPAFYVPPPGLGPAGAVALISLDGLAASAPARIRLALKALAKGLIGNEDSVSPHPRK